MTPREHVACAVEAAVYYARIALATPFMMVWFVCSSVARGAEVAAESILPEGWT